jgi:hypothetical protein
LNYPVTVKDFYRKPVILHSEEDLYKFHEKNAQDKADSASKKMHQKVLPDDFAPWLFKSGICPYGVISSTSKYWMELMSIMDTEMGLNLPDTYKNVPSIFFDVLRIHRDSRPVEDTSGK